MGFYMFMARMETSRWWRRVLIAIGKRAASLRRLSRSINKRKGEMNWRLRIRSLLTGGFTFATSGPCGLTTSRPAARYLYWLEPNRPPDLVDCRRVCLGALLAHY